MTFNIILIVVGLAVLCIGMYLNRSCIRTSGKETVIQSDEFTPRKAVKSLPPIDLAENGKDPSGSVELSSLESVCIANEPDVSELSISDDDIKNELKELGYRIEKSASPSRILEGNTVIDAFDDGRYYFPAPETSGLGDDFTPADNQ